MVVILHFAVLSAYFTMLLKWLCEYSIALSLQCFDTVDRKGIQPVKKWVLVVRI